MLAVMLLFVLPSCSGFGSPATWPCVSGRGAERKRSLSCPVSVRAATQVGLMCARGGGEQDAATVDICITTNQLPVVKLKGPHYFESFLPFIKAALLGKSHRYMVELMGG